jgi:hypothetical protein
VVVASFSPALLSTGTVAVSIGASGECSGVDCDRKRAATTLGAGLIAAGIALAVGGIVMALRGRTKVELRRRGAVAP